MKIVGIILICTVAYMILTKLICNLLYFHDEKRINR